jgi:electron transfer flavoprotein alpha subunit
MTIYTVTTPEADEYPASREAEVLVELASRKSPSAIVIASSPLGQEIAARVAVQLNSGIVTDAIDVRMGPDGPIAVQAVFAGSYFVESSVLRGIPVFTIRPEAIVLEAAPVDPIVEPVDMRFVDTVRAARRVSRVPSPTPDRPNLTKAAVVVAGGRGVGSQESFSLVSRMADALGGAVGGSHTAAELGWCQPDLRVGQIGRVVHPSLYVALGISGSVRHRAGMQGAGTIVAIDKDPMAPIFDIADFGVVGDLHQVVPALLAEITRRKTQSDIETPNLSEA